MIDKTSKLTVMIGPTSRSNTLADRHVRLSNVPSKASMAACRFSRTKGAGHATGSNPARLSHRSPFNAAAAGKSGVGRTLSRVTGLASQELGLSTVAIARPLLSISGDWKAITRRITWARRVDLRRTGRERRDDWAVRRASRDFRGQRQCSWMLSNQLMTDDNT